MAFAPTTLPVGSSYNQTTPSSYAPVSSYTPGTTYSNNYNNERSYVTTTPQQQHHYQGEPTSYNYSSIGGPYVTNTRPLIGFGQGGNPTVNGQSFQYTSDSNHRYIPNGTQAVSDFPHGISTIYNNVPLFMSAPNVQISPAEVCKWSNVTREANASRMEPRL